MPKHDKKLRTQLTALDAATQPQDLGVIPGWRLHALKGDQVGRWSITVNGNWRLTFTFEGTDVVLLDYEDYHEERRHEPDAQPLPPRRSAQGGLARNQRD